MKSHFLLVTWIRVPAPHESSACRILLFSVITEPFDIQAQDFRGGKRIIFHFHYSHKMNSFIIIPVLVTVGVSHRCEYIYGSIFMWFGAVFRHFPAKTST